MKRSVAVVFVLVFFLTFFVFGLPIGPRSARAQIAPETVPLPPNARASGSTGVTHSAGASQVAQAKSSKSDKTANAATSARPHHKVPRMVFVVTATRMEQPLDTVAPP